MSSTGGILPLTDNALREERPAWSPDGRMIAYVAPASMPGQVWYYSIFVMTIDGKYQREITSGPYHMMCLHG